MVFDWRNNRINIVRIIAVLIITCIATCTFAANVKQIKQSSYKVSGGKQTYSDYADNDINFIMDEEDDNVGSYVKNWSASKQFNVINRIGNRLLAVSNIPTSRKVTFQVVRKYDANAYTDWNYNVIVYRGILNYVENEDEIAFVIGHELGHIEYMHARLGIAKRIGVGVAGSVIGSVIPGAGVLTPLAAKSTNNKLSRVDEYAADRKSIDYLAKAGYNPLASISLLNKIGVNYVEFWHDHPATPKRIARAYEYIKNTYPKYLQEGFDTQSYEIAIQKIQLMQDSDNKIKVKSKQTKKSESNENL